MESIGKIVFYEDKNFQGHHFEYCSDCPELSSHFSHCNSIRVENGNWKWELGVETSGKFRIRLYERPDFAGQMMEFSEDNPNLPEHWRHPEVHSCNVMDGTWVFYELPNYRGHQHLLERGEYRHFNDWRSNVGSIRRVQNL
ncbi:gamma-crystallin-3-like [Oncorhynchus masou masou]|uniref:gamma-crystallin-3-like n=1 Tax=Oncorhynchus masou masou TaxID=90313 RepID=UPI003183BACD